jgi:hypothetical protein
MAHLTEWKIQSDCPSGPTRTTLASNLLSAKADQEVPSNPNTSQKQANDFMLFLSETNESLTELAASRPAQEPVAGIV